MIWIVRPRLRGEAPPAFRLYSEDGRRFTLTRDELVGLVNSGNASLGEAISAAEGGARPRIDERQIRDAAITAQHDGGSMATIAWRTVVALVRQLEQKR